MRPITPQQTVTSPNSWLPQLRSFLLGFGVGSLPGAIFLAAAWSFIHAALLAPVLGVAYAVYLVGLPAAAWLARPSKRALIGIGFLVGFAASTFVLVILLVIGASLAALAS